MSPSLLEPDCLQVQTGPASGKRSLETIKKKKKKRTECLVTMEHSPEGTVATQVALS